MSEYQYYEFRTLNRALTAQEKTDIRTLSSRVQLTSNSASFTYNYDDFRGNPRQVLTQYFDAMLYQTNWGTRQLMFRFPQNSIPAEVMNAYQYDNSIEWFTEGEYIVLNVEFNDEEGGGNWEWDEQEVTLSGLMPLYEDILRGDYRALYLAWLMIAEYESGVLEEDEALIEPPVPPNLKTLSSPLQDFIRFFGMTRNLVSAAAQASPAAEKTTSKLSQHIALLSEAEKHDFLRRLLEGESHLDLALANRLRDVSGVEDSPSSAEARRTITQLLEIAEALTLQEKAAEKQKAEAARLKKLEALAPQEAQLWAKIRDLIPEKKSAAYDEAIPILSDLRDLLTHQGRAAEFKTKIATISAQYPTLTGFQRRLKDNKLV